MAVVRAVPSHPPLGRKPGPGGVGVTLGDGGHPRRRGRCSRPACGSGAGHGTGLGTASRRQGCAARVPTVAAPGQVLGATGQVDPLGGPRRVLAVGQDQRIAVYVHRAEGQDLVDAGAGRPQDPHQQPIALAGRRGDDGLRVLGAEPFGRLPMP